MTRRAVCLRLLDLARLALLHMRLRLARPLPAVGAALLAALDRLAAKRARR